MTRLEGAATAGVASSAERRAALRPTAAVTGVIVSAAIPPFLVGALAPLIARDMSFGASAVGIGIAAYYLVSGVLSPLGGWTVGRIGVVLSLRLTCAMTTVGLLAIAAAGSAAHIVVVLGILGLPNSVVQPAANAVLAEVRAGRLQALVFGVVQAAIPTATLIAGVVLGVASYAGGWRWTVLAVAVLTVGALWGTRTLPATVRRPRVVPPGPVGPRPAAVAAPHGSPWVLAALVATGFLGSTAATSLPSYVASTGLASGLSPGVVASAQVLGSIACAATRIGAPLGVSHATTLRRLVLIGSLLVLGGLGFLCLASGTPAGFLVGTVAAYAFGWGWNGLFNLVVVGVRPDRIAAATGRTQAGIFLGGLVGPLTFAAVVHQHGYDLAWLVASGAALAAAGAATCGMLAVRHGTPPRR
ncbi:MFS transporter [Nocardioides nitrophenolicus]|uniref:MFS transporter n=1 Tax=Nocardioides nitrophenolicus TaxID=60489 RepID=UPI00195B8F08|nr:MFS transporter [Nocardioides nitrophenolicus]MBM7517074.1 MFS family permease [Nocardioides nitrophenolicus]